jgi:hypothetical protein
VALDSFQPDTLVYMRTGNLFLIFAALLLSAFVAAPTSQAQSFKIGDPGPGGGVIFYRDGNQYWELAPESVCDNTIKHPLCEQPDAARLAEEYSTPTADDWYLPSREELRAAQRSLARTAAKRKRYAKYGINKQSCYWTTSQNTTPSEVYYQGRLGKSTVCGYQPMDYVAKARGIRTFTL